MNYTLISKLIYLSLNIIYLKIYNILFIKDCYPNYNNNDFYILFDLGEQINIANFIQYNIFELSIDSTIGITINFICNLYGPTLLKDSNIKCFLKDKIPLNTELIFILKEVNYQKTFIVEIDENLQLFTLQNNNTIFFPKIINNCNNSLKKIAVCYITNNKNYEKIIFKLYDKLISYLNRTKYDVYIIISNETNNNTINKKWENISNNVITYRYYKLKELLNYNYIFDDTNGYDYIGNCQLPIIYFSKIHPEYIGYLFYEDDVYINFKDNLFNIINFGDFDAFLQNKRKVDKYWYWANGGLHSDFGNLITHYSGLYNIYYISKKTLNEFYNWFIKNNYYGHHELLYNIFFNFYQNKYNIGYFENYIDEYTDWCKSNELLQYAFFNKSVYLIFHQCKSENYFIILESLSLIFNNNNWTHLLQ